MANWKSDPKTQTAYNELYSHIDPNDENSDTYVTKIIKSTFINNDRTTLNAIWVQAVLEVIFDPEYLSPKLDTDVVDQHFTDLCEEQEKQISLYIIVNLNNNSYSGISINKFNK